MRFLTVCSITGLLLFPGSASAQSNLVSLISQPGDSIGGGQSYVTTNLASFSLVGTPATLSVSAFGFDIQFDGPGSDTLSVGKYTNAVRYPFNDSSPGLTVSGNGRGCNTVCGFFQILELHTDGSGNVDRYWATFTHSCECFMPPMAGEVRYHSQLAPPAPAPRTIRVPGDYPNIQAALYNASLLAADTILVAPGTYFENLDFKGKAVSLVSESGPGVTIIDGRNSGPVITFGSGEGRSSMVKGFTLQHGSANWGAGITLQGSSPTIVGNLFQNNSQGAGGFGAGIGGNVSSPIIQQNIFRDNTADDQFLSGVVSFVNNSSPIIADNVFLKNPCRAINLTLPEGTSPIVINNTVVSNKVGIRVDARVNTTNQAYQNNILVGNMIGLEADFGSAANYPTWSNNLVTGGQNYQGIPDQTGMNGNLSTNPLFVCPPGDDYHLLAESPCIDRATNGGAPQLPATDFDGTPRILDGDKNGVAVADMGAFELNPSAPPVPCLYITCPPDIVVAVAAGQNSVSVNYPDASGTPVATVTSSPPSGSVFPGGTNTVTCTARYGTNSASCTFTVTVLVPPIITSQPQNKNVLAGQPLSLTVGAEGSTPLTYSWTFEGNTISGGATNSMLTISNAQAANEGIYRALVANSVGLATSAVAFVRVLPSAPTIISSPASLSLPASSNATFGVVASGSQPLGYQWLFNHAPLAGATASQYSLSNVQATNAGDYQVMVANSLGAVTSVVATLTVTPLAPYFVTQPTSASVAVGSSHTFTGLARGSEPISYRWQHDGVELAVTQPALSLSNLGLNDSGGYSLVASNIGGVSTSIVAQLVVYEPPTLLQGLTNQVVDVGSDVLLAVAARASPAPAYSWQFNDALVAGTNATLAITNIQAIQSGFYRVTVANQYGTNSSTARISVLGPQSFVLAWGDNSGNQTNVPAALNDVVAVAGGDYHSLGLRHDGSLFAWGYNGDGQTTVPTNALRFVSIAAGAGHNLAITENGSVVAWGRNDFAQCNVPPSTGNKVLAVAGGDAHSSALLSTGTIINWGDDSFRQVSGSVNLTAVRAIAAGRHHGLALRSDGTVAGWGFNAYGQAAPPPELTDVTAIAAGYLHSAALRSDGTVAVWGDNSYGQTNVPPGLSNVVAIAAGDFHTFAMRADGSVVGWGDTRFGQTDVPSSIVDALGVSSGYYHGLALIPFNRLRLRSILSGLLIEWRGTGVLECAPAPSGPYHEIPALLQSYTNSDFSEQARFFRLRRE